MARALHLPLSANSLGRRQSEHGPIYFFADPLLKGDQEEAPLRKVEQGTLTEDEYEDKKEQAGIFVLISDLDRAGPEIYQLYKERQDGEVAFDAMKHVLDANATYMQNDDDVRGYFFAALLALRVYFGVLKRLRERDLTGDLSVREV